MSSFIEQTLNSLGQQYFKNGVLLVGNASFANYKTDGTDDQVQLQEAIDIASNNPLASPSSPAVVKVISNLNVNAVGTFTETLGGVSRRLAVRLRNNVKVMIEAGCTISFGSGGNSGFNGGTVFTSVFGNFGNLQGASVVCEGVNGFDGLSSTIGTSTNRHSAVWLDARSGACTILRDCVFEVTGRRTAGDLVRAYNSNSAGTTIAVNLNFKIVDAQSCLTGGLVERNGESVNVEVININASLSDGLVYKDGVENSVVIINRITNSVNSAFKAVTDTAISTKFHDLQIKVGNVETSGDHGMSIQGVNGQIELSSWNNQKNGIFFDVVQLGATFFYPRKLVLSNPTANNNNQSASTWSGIGGVIQNLDIIGFEASDRQGVATQYRGIDFTDVKNDYVNIVSGTAQGNTNAQVRVVGVNSRVSRDGVIGFNRIYTVPNAVTYTIAGPEDMYLLGAASVVRLPKFSRYNLNAFPLIYIACQSGTAQVQAEQEDDLSYRAIDTLAANVPFVVTNNQCFAFQKYADKWRATINTTGTLPTITNSTLSTGTRLDDNAGENFSFHSQARQLLDNGNFEIWQRRVTATNPTGIIPVADRWRLINDVTGTPPTTIIHSRQTVNPGDTLKSNYFYRINTSGAGAGFGGNNVYGLEQHVFGAVRSFCGVSKTVTVSFRAKSNITGKKLGIYLIQHYGTGGAPSASEALAGTNITLTGTETLYKFTFNTNTLIGKTFGTNADDKLILGIAQMWGSSTYAGYVNSAGVGETFRGSGDVDIAQFQLCAGSVALPFQPKKFDEELTECKRYYQKSFLYNITPAQNIGQDGCYLAMQIGIAGSTLFIQKTLDVSISPKVFLSSASVIVTTFNTSALNALARNTTILNDAALTYQSSSSEREFRWAFVATAGSAANNPYVFHWTIDSQF